MSGRLLLVIPPVIEPRGVDFVIETHFANNLKAYLEAFDHVTVACPPADMGAGGTLTLDQVEGHERATIIPLPTPYREDRYFRHRASVSRLLRSEIEKADYLLVSPHSAFDWSTLAAKLAMAMGRPFDMEGDWDLENVWGFQIAEMPAGLKKLRKQLWLRMQMRDYERCMRRSSLALLQGQDVFDAYKDWAPNPHKVLNVQMTENDLIPVQAVRAKAEEVRSGAPLSIVYAGRVIGMKGPLDWIAALDEVAALGVPFEARWFGGGDMLVQAKAECERRGIADRVRFVGPAPRETVLEAVQQAHVFLFSHKTLESPRCVVEAIASGTPIVGYRSGYVEDLVAPHGGGAFVPLGDHQKLAQTLSELHSDRKTLTAMMEQARASASLLDRDEAIRQRIQLIKIYVKPAGESAQIR